MIYGNELLVHVELGSCNTADLMIHFGVKSCGVELGTPFVTRSPENPPH